jgi:hypothetical protein
MAQLEGRELEGHEVLEKGDVFWCLDDPPDRVYVVDVNAGRTVDSMNAQFKRYAVPTTAIFRRPTNKQEIE